MANYDLNKTRYTHRDYESIKSDLIEAIPSLTKEWTSREESDPGIVLIKLMSMFGDSLSYNMDKMALEMYLQTVSQRKNCSKILKLLGYKMHWYRSARVMTDIRLIDVTDASGNYTRVILKPYKTQFLAGNIKYTVLPQGSGSSGDIDIYSATNSVQVKLIQGDPVSYSFNKNDLINNRYYFGSSNIDESEIILEVDGASSSAITCELVEDLYTSSSSNIIYYEFDVDEQDRPYIQLADDWSDITGTFETTFNITYILSNGSRGNITDNAFNPSYTIEAGGNASNLIISNKDNTTRYGSGSDDQNYYEIYNSPGQDPQTVSEAREDAANYVFTHDTLVTSFDFEKACRRVDGITVSKLVDNQVILNDGLNVDDILIRAWDNWTVNDNNELLPYLALMYLGYMNFNPENNSYYTINPTNVDESYRYSLNIYRNNFLEDVYWSDYWKDTYNAEYDDGIWVEKEEIEDPDPSTYPGYYPYKITNNLQLSLRDLLSKLKIINVNIDFGTVKLFPFRVKGYIHLINKYSPDETLQVIDNINDTLHIYYYPDRHPVGEKPNFIELVDIIQSSDAKIKYFDAIGNIVEWAPVVSKYINASGDNELSILDTTSAIIYNGLSDEFNLSQRFLSFKFRNVLSPLTDYELNSLSIDLVGTEGVVYNIPEDYGTAYLFNTSQLIEGISYNENDIPYYEVISIKPNSDKVVSLQNIKQLRALCEDIHYSNSVILPVLRLYKNGGEVTVIDIQEGSDFFLIDDGPFEIQSIGKGSNGDQPLEGLIEIIINDNYQFNIDDPSKLVGSNSRDYINDSLSVSNLTDIKENIVIKLVFEEGVDIPSNSKIKIKYYKDEIYTDDYVDKKGPYSSDDESQRMINKSVSINNTGLKWTEA